MSKLLPYNRHNLGSIKIRKLLSFALIFGVLQGISFTYQVIEAPKVNAASTYTPTDYPTGSTWTVPTGVDTITFTALGGGAGQGGLDGAGNTVKYPGARGYVSGSLRLNAGDVIGIYPGRAGANGVGGTGNGGGTGGIGTYPTTNYSGGTGGNAGSSGSSGGGGGGGAASLLTIGSTIYAVAGGAGGAGGSANWSGSGQNGQSTNSQNTGVNTGGNGVQTSTSNAGSGKNCTNSTNDGGGGGGGGGGSYGGSGGGLENAGTGECSGLGGYRGNNYLISNSALTNTSNTTDPNASNSNNALEGSISITANLSVPSSINLISSTQSFTVSWATAAAAQRFYVKIYNSSGNSLLETVTVSSGTYTKTVTTADYSSLATNTTYQVSVIAIGNSAAPYIDSAESAKFTVTTSTPSEIDSALTLNGSNQYASAPEGSTYNIQDAITLEAWTYSTNASSSGAVICKQAEYLLMTEGGYWKYYLQGATGWAGVSTGIPVVANEWHHVALTRAASTNSVKFYLDGNLAFTGSADGWGSGSINNTTNDIVIGSHNKASSYFPGQIDEVKIWSVARTQAQVQSDLKSYGGALVDGLVAYHDFNELVGTTLLNRSTGGSASLDLTTSNSPTLSSVAIESTYLAYTVTTFPRTYLVAAGGWKVPSGVSSIKSLVIGGGGAGGSRSGGGGGAGGYVFDGSLSVTPLSFQFIVVGVGGIGDSNTADSSGKNGTNSSLGTLRYALGGGGGGWNGLSNDTYRVGKSGGSGGGAASNNAGTASATVGTATQFSTYNYGVGFNGGQTVPGGNYAAGGGGGAAGVGGNGNPSPNTGGKGGSGLIDPIGGTSTCYATGGGGGIYIGKTAGSGGDCGGTSNPNTNSGTTGSIRPSTAKANTGSGGGGSGFSSLSDVYNDAPGGNGASGVVVIAYITYKPTIITQPLSDTTTAGIVETFTITTSVAPTPLTKSVQWQYTADTTTGTTGWTNLAAGSGFTTDTFTTVSLTKSMNKYRYRAIVSFSDTTTLTVVETSTVAILTINDSITITSSTSSITQKYGNTQVVRSLAYSGGTTSSGLVGTSTSHTVSSTNGPLASGKIYLDTTTSTTIIKVDTGTAAGSYSLNVTVTDFKGAITSYSQSIVVSQADTLTIQADTLTAITFGSTVTPTYTATGLVAGDAINSITYGHVSCANGGTCAVGDIGPGGGVVFYIITNSSDSQTAVAGITSGGIYLEAAPVGWGNGISVAAGETTGTAYLDPIVNWCNVSTSIGASQFGMGQGGINTSVINTNCTSGAGKIAANLVLNGKSDWYLPSSDELTQMGNQRNLVGLIYGQTDCWGTSYCYWSSTQNDGSSAKALQVLAGSVVIGNNDKALSANNKVAVRPIRAFSPAVTGSETVTAGAPTAAGSYTLRPTAITLANGVSTSNYVSVVFQSSALTINRATQSPKISMQTSKVAYDTGTATQALISFGGSGTGQVFYVINSGTGCSISGSNIRKTSEGTCYVSAFKQASTNYLYDSSTSVAYVFEKFVSNQQVQMQSVPTQLPINGKSALETTTLTVPVITSIVYDEGGRRLVNGNFQTISPNYTINGSGFTGAVRIIRNFTDFSDFYFISDSALNITGSRNDPSSFGSTGGPVFIECSDGRMGPVPFYFFTP